MNEKPDEIKTEGDLDVKINHFSKRKGYPQSFWVYDDR